MLETSEPFDERLSHVATAHRLAERLHHCLLETKSVLLEERASSDNKYVRSFTISSWCRARAESILRPTGLGRVWLSGFAVDGSAIARVISAVLLVGLMHTRPCLPWRRLSSLTGYRFAYRLLGGALYATWPQTFLWRTGAGAGAGASSHNLLEGRRCMWESQHAWSSTIGHRYRNRRGRTSHSALVGTPSLS
jgi:hypothetical protein